MRPSHVLALAGVVAADVTISVTTGITTDVVLPDWKTGAGIVAPPAVTLTVDGPPTTVVTGTTTTVTPVTQITLTKSIPLAPNATSVRPPVVTAEAGRFQPSLMGLVGFCMVCLAVL